MAKGKKSFLFYTDWFEIFKELPPEKGYELIMHILSYVNDEDPQTEDPFIKLAFAPIKSSLKRDLDKWESKREVLRENGRAGGLAKARNAKQKPAKASNVKQTLANLPVNVSVNANVNDEYSIHNEFIGSIIQTKNGIHKSWIEGVYQKFGIRKGYLNDLIQDFAAHLKVQEKVHHDFNQFKNHFVNWVSQLEGKPQLEKYKLRKEGQL
ncbi:DUF6291 domain-containing protein [Flagellimonas aurea]|uniref:DUF6291 domain-containing protein n=1 Tax=Flagellimonas aurea TaxID=2915619 RepID=UPI0035D04A66